jgi:hypothetical protein
MCDDGKPCAGFEEFYAEHVLNGSGRGRAGCGFEQVFPFSAEDMFAESLLECWHTGAPLPETV